jgi:AraC-like DNA-binding protein
VNDFLRRYNDQNLWHNQFLENVVNQADDGIFKPLFEDKMGAPNIPIRQLIGINILKEGFGISDEQMFDQVQFHILVRKVIEKNLIDSDLNVDEIGKNLGLSRVQLYRKIKSLTNYAPNELVRIIRLKAAEQMFINTEKTISKVAYDTGFTSPSYFTKCFKEYFNESPTDFITRLKR